MDFNKTAYISQTRCKVEDLKLKAKTKELDGKIKKLKTLAENNVSERESRHKSIKTNLANRKLVIEADIINLDKQHSNELDELTEKNINLEDDLRKEHDNIIEFSEYEGNRKISDLKAKQDIEIRELEIRQQAFTDESKKLKIKYNTEYENVVLQAAMQFADQARDHMLEKKAMRNSVISARDNLITNQHREMSKLFKENTRKRAELDRKNYKIIQDVRDLLFDRYTMPMIELETSISTDLSEIKADILTENIRRKEDDLSIPFITEIMIGDTIVNVDNAYVIKT